MTWVKELQVTVIGTAITRRRFKKLNASIRNNQKLATKTTISLIRYGLSGIIIIIILARTPEIGQGLGCILSCGARKPEQT